MIIQQVSFRSFRFIDGQLLLDNRDRYVVSFVSLNMAQGKGRT